MKKTLSSLIAFVLALVMAMSALPVGAAALPNTDSVKAETSAEAKVEAENTKTDVQPCLNMSYTPSSAYRSSKYYAQLTNVSLTGNQRTDIVNVAISQLGYHEGNNSSELHGGNTSGSGSYTEYGYWYGSQSDWCAMFVTWCARQAGIGSNIIAKSGFACPDSDCLNVPFKSRGSYTPVPGDLIFFLWEEDAGNWNWSHVGIVRSVSGGRVYTIEGNTSRAVRYREYSLTDSEIKGYGVPNYTVPTENTVAKPEITTASANKDTGVVTIKWSKPANAHYYTLKFYKASDNTLVETVKNITATTYTTELNAGKYYVKVTAYNADGSSSKTSDRSKTFIAPLVWTFTTNKSASLNDAPENGLTIRYIATGKTVKATEFAGAKLSRAKVKYGDDRGWVYYGALDTVKDPTWVFKVNKSLKMRAGVSTESAELAILPAGTVFVVTEIQGNRGKTTYNGMTGWVTYTLAKRITDPTQFTMPPKDTTFAQGATGEHVQWLQACLWQMGYFCELNGTYDADTEAALKLFKTRHGLSTTNGFNNACREKLLDLFTCSTPKITYTIKGNIATVTIGNINAWGTAHYTTNGSAPTASSTKYTGEFTVARGKTVKAMTVKPCRYDSAVATKTVTSAKNATVNPTFSMPCC